MYLLVSDGTAEVCEADDCTSLEVRLEAGGGADALASADLGRWDGGSEIDLGLERLHTLARASATMPDWELRWSAMIEYAARSGWLAPDGTTVRAHVVRT